MPPALPDPSPLILTAVFDDGAATLLQSLRDRHFPPRLNIVPAHCTLFHHLPGEDLVVILRELALRCAGHTPLPFASRGLRFLGRGVAVEIEAPALVGLRAALAERWRPWLTAQDRQGFRPHVTVQNKVAPDEARALHARLGAELPPIHGTIRGLALWHYRGGPWVEAGGFDFRG